MDKKINNQQQLKRLAGMSDEIGLIQHSKIDEPDLAHGYSIDDVARGLIVLSRNFHHYNDEGLHHTYFNYIKEAKREDGYFHNFKTEGGNWIPEGKEALGDCYGRVLWSLAEFCNSSYPQKEKDEASDLFRESLDSMSALILPHSIAFSLIGTSIFLTGSKEKKVMDIARESAGQLQKLFQENSSDSWEWPSQELTYCNARIPHSMLLAGKTLGDTLLFNKGLSSLDFLIKESFSDEYFHAIGNEGWYRNGAEKAQFDEQTIEAGAMIEACDSAHVLTRKKEYATHSKNALQWFYGQNRSQTQMMDSGGGVYDSITRGGANLNQGAESLLAYLLATSPMKYDF